MVLYRGRSTAVRGEQREFCARKFHCSLIISGRVLAAIGRPVLTPNPIARRLDSERVEPFVDISGLFAAKCPQ
jgi:hypothetical protein